MLRRSASWGGGSPKCAALVHPTAFQTSGEGGSPKCAALVHAESAEPREPAEGSFSAASRKLCALCVRQRSRPQAKEKARSAQRWFTQRAQSHGRPQRGVSLRPLGSSA